MNGNSLPYFNAPLQNYSQAANNGYTAEGSGGVSHDDVRNFGGAGPSRVGRSLSTEEEPEKQQRPSKRPKIYQACEFCQKRKKRCEGITMSGCSRCSSEGRTCSLASVTAPGLAIGPSAGMPGPGLAGLVNNTGQSGYGPPPTSSTASNPTQIDHSTRDALVSANNLISQVQEKNGTLQKTVEGLTGRVKLLEEKLGVGEGGGSTSRNSFSLGTADGQAQSQSQLHPNGRPSSTAKALGVEESPASVLSHNTNNSTTSQPSHPLFQPEKRGTTLLFSERYFASQEDVVMNGGLVGDGLVSKDFMEMCYHFFKQHFYRILPLDLFSPSRSPTPPTDKFISLAILTYTSRARPGFFNASLGSAPNLPSTLEKLVDQSLLSILSGSVSTQHLLALLILSLAPSPPTNGGPDGKTTASATPYRLMCVAYTLGVSLGIERICLEALGRGKELLEPWMVDRLELIQTWIAIENRYHLLSYMQSRSPRLHNKHSPLIAQLTQAYNSHNRVDPSIQHLTMELKLVNAASELVEVLENLEGITSCVEEDWKELEDAWNVFDTACQGMQKTLDQFTGLVSASLLELDLRSLRCTISMRMLSLQINLPFPIHPDIRYEAQRVAGATMVSCTADMLKTKVFNGPSLGTIWDLPAHSTAVVALAIMLQLRTHDFLETYEPGSGKIDIDLAQRVEKKMASGNGPATSLIQHYKDHLVERAAARAPEVVDVEVEATGAPGVRAGIGAGLGDSIDWSNLTLDNFFNFDFGAALGGV